MFRYFSESNKGQFNFCWLLLLCTFCAFSVNAEAETIRLFSYKKQVENYNELMAELTKKRGKFEAPVRLLFDDKEPIVVTEFLGKGGLTAVFKRVDGRALRVPLAHGDAYFPNGPNGAIRNNGPYTHAMLGFYTSMLKLSAAGAPVPKIFVEDSYLPEFITVEYFENRMNLWDFFRRRQEGLEKKRIQPEQVAKLIEQLEVFVRSFAGYSWIGDFKTEQVVTDGNTWKLVDSSDPVFRITSVTETSPFDHRLMGARLGPNINIWFQMLIAEYRDEHPELVQSKKQLPEPALRCELILFSF